jgi:transposase
MKLTG